MDREGLDLESQFGLNPVLSVIVTLFGGLKYPHHSPNGVSLRDWACKTVFLLEVSVGTRGGPVSLQKKNTQRALKCLENTSNSEGLRSKVLMPRSVWEGGSLCACPLVPLLGWAYSPNGYSTRSQDLWSGPVLAFLWDCLMLHQCFCQEL